MEQEQNIFPLINERALLELKLCFLDTDRLDEAAVGKLMEFYALKLKYRTNGIQVVGFWNGLRKKDWTPTSTQLMYPEMLPELPSVAGMRDLCSSRVIRGSWLTGEQI